MNTDEDRLLVITPSRLQRDTNGDILLRRAAASVFRQRAASILTIDMVVGVDPGTAIPSNFDLPPSVRFVVADDASQASALNAAARSLDHSYLAILEDDDEWHPDFLDLAIKALKRADFVSSTQLEVDAWGENIAIFDFPTPSGWVMRRAVWECVGPFDADYRIHIDNEWLGRLAETGRRRSHLIEATAPIDLTIVATLRPDLHRVVTQGGPSSSLVRHHMPVPLVRRLVHSGSTMNKALHDPVAHRQVREESKRLQQRYGHLPW